MNNKAPVTPIEIAVISDFSLIVAFRAAVITPTSVNQTEGNPTARTLPDII